MAFLCSFAKQVAINFEILKDAKTTLEPTSTICEFEHRTFQVVREAFPEVEIQAYFFYLAPNIHKKIAAMDVTSMCNNDATFALKAKIILNHHIPNINHHNI